MTRSTTPVRLCLLASLVLLPATAFAQFTVIDSDATHVGIDDSYDKTLPPPLISQCGQTAFLPATDWSFWSCTRAMASVTDQIDAFLSEAEMDCKAVGGTLVVVAAHHSPAEGVCSSLTTEWWYSASAQVTCDCGQKDHLYLIDRCGDVAGYTVYNAPVGDAECSTVIEGALNTLDAWMSLQDDRCTAVGGTMSWAKIASRPGAETCDVYSVGAVDHEVSTRGTCVCGGAKFQKGSALFSGE